MTLISDSSVVFAALSPRELHHEVCTAELERAAVTVIPAPVLVEVDWLARSRGVRDVMDRVLGSIGDRSITVVDLDEEEYRRIRALLRTYADLGLEFVDAAVIAIAERLEEDTIATLDRRQFSVVKPLHVEAFTLVPD